MFTPIHQVLFQNIVLIMVVVLVLFYFTPYAAMSQNNQYLTVQYHTLMLYVFLIKMMLEWSASVSLESILYAVINIINCYYT